MSDDESLKDFEAFLGIMLTTWDYDDMAYMHQRVMHPSYGGGPCGYCREYTCKGKCDPTSS